MPWLHQNCILSSSPPPRSRKVVVSEPASLHHGAFGLAGKIHRRLQRQRQAAVRVQALHEQWCRPAPSAAGPKGKVRLWRKVCRRKERHHWRAHRRRGRLSGFGLLGSTYGYAQKLGVRVGYLLESGDRRRRNLEDSDARIRGTQPDSEPNKSSPWKTVFFELYSAGALCLYACTGPFLAWDAR